MRSINYKISGPAEKQGSGMIDLYPVTVRDDGVLCTWRKVMERAVETGLVTEPGTYVIVKGDDIAWIKVETSATPLVIV